MQHKKRVYILGKITMSIQQSMRRRPVKCALLPDARNVREISKSDRNHAAWRSWIRRRVQNTTPINSNSDQSTVIIKNPPSTLLFTFTSVGNFIFYVS